MCSGLSLFLDTMQARIAELSTCPKELFISFFLKFCESYCYFSLSQILVIYLHTEFGISDVEAGFMYGMWGAAATFWGLSTSWLNDNLGVRKSLLLGSTLSAIVSFLIATAQSKEMMYVCLLVLLPLGNSMGIPMLTIGIKRYTTSTNRGFAFGLFYAVMNVAAFVSGPVVDFFNIALKDGARIGAVHLSGNRMVILTTVLVYTCSFMTTLSSLREIRVNENQDGSVSMSISGTTASPLTSLSPDDAVSNPLREHVDKGGRGDRSTHRDRHRQRKEVECSMDTAGEFRSPSRVDEIVPSGCGSGSGSGSDSSSPYFRTFSLDAFKREQGERIRRVLFGDYSMLNTDNEGSFNADGVSGSTIGVALGDLETTETSGPRDRNIHEEKDTDRKGRGRERGREIDVHFAYQQVSSFPLTAHSPQSPPAHFSTPSKTSAERETAAFLTLATSPPLYPYSYNEITVEVEKAESSYVATGASIDGLAASNRYNSAESAAGSTDLPGHHGLKEAQNQQQQRKQQQEQDRDEYAEEQGAGYTLQQGGYSSVLDDVYPPRSQDYSLPPSASKLRREDRNRYQTNNSNNNDNTNKHSLMLRNPSVLPTSSPYSNFSSISSSSSSSSSSSAAATSTSSAHTRKKAQNGHPPSAQLQSFSPFHVVESPSPVLSLSSATRPSSTTAATTAVRTIRTTAAANQTAPVSEPEGYSSYQPEQQSLWATAKVLCTSPTFWRFSIFTVLLINLRTIFRHLDATLPTYLVRCFGSDYPKGTIYSINPFMIMFLTPVVSALTSTWPHFDMIKYGGYISAVSPFLMAFSTSTWAVVMFVVMLSLGESIWGPRLYDYTMSIAPEGREASFSALASAPLFAAKVPVGLMSGYLLSTYLPDEQGRTREEQRAGAQRMWLIIGLVTLTSPILVTLLERWIREPVAPKTLLTVASPAEEVTAHSALDSAVVSTIGANGADGGGDGGGMKREKDREEQEKEVEEGNIREKRISMMMMSSTISDKSSRRDDFSGAGREKGSNDIEMVARSRAESGEPLTHKYV